MLCNLVYQVPPQLLSGPDPEFAKKRKYKESYQDLQKYLKRKLEYDVKNICKYVTGLAAIFFYYHLSPIHIQFCKRCFSSSIRTRVVFAFHSGLRLRAGCVLC